MDGSWNERAVIVTGGAGGVGQVVSRRWLDRGASVLVVDHAQESVDRFAAANQDTGGRLKTLAADLAAQDGAASMADEATRVFGRPADTLIHLVGGFGMGRVDAADAPALWNKMMALNLTTAFHAYRAVLPGMQQSSNGWIVGLASRVAVTPSGELAAYAASKAGLIALTRALADEVRNQNIHVNVLLASVIDTPANRQAMGDEAAEKWVSPDDIADATFYLCSAQARAIHGATLEIYAKS